MESDSLTAQSKADEILVNERALAESLATSGVCACDEWLKVLDIIKFAEGPGDPALTAAVLLGIGAELRELNETMDDLNDIGITIYTP